MRRVRYNVAMSLDGYIAGPHGEFDWIPEDSTVDFHGLFANVDTVLLGRSSYEAARAMSGEPAWPRGSRIYVFSRTLPSDAYSNATVVRENAAGVVSALRNESGRGEIWLYGGGQLFSSLIAARQVDAIEITVVPVIIGGGIPMAMPSGVRTALRLTGTKTYPSGMVTLNYAV